MKNKNLLHGFSLIELMIVVAIIGIIASIALPSYQEQIRKSRRTDGLDALYNCASEQNRYFSASSPPSYFSEAVAKGASLSACGWDGTNFTSSSGHYTLAITNPNCASGSSTWCYVLTATPVGGQAADKKCQSLALDHRGNKSSKDDSNADSTAICMKN